MRITIFANTNIQYLQDIGYIKFCGGDFVSIEEIAIESVIEYRDNIKDANDFEDLIKIKPQKRGILFQKMIGRMIEKDGWNQEEGVKTSNEEMDVIFYKDREYFLVECKWEKYPIGAEVIRSFKGKLDNRIGTNGLIFSMSGFTRGAVKQVEDYLNQRLIILFGQKDVESIIYNDNKFEGLLNTKIHNLVTIKKVTYN